MGGSPGGAGSKAASVCGVFSVVVAGWEVSWGARGEMREIGGFFWSLSLCSCSSELPAEKGGVPRAVLYPGLKLAYGSSGVSPQLLNFL